MQDKGNSEEKSVHRLNRRTFLKATLGAGGALLLSACSSAPSSSPTAAPATKAPSDAVTSAPAPGKPSGTLTVAMARIIETLDPPGSLSTGNWTISMLMFDPLVRIDAQGKIQPCLATSWETVDPLTWKFTLRKGVKFHDGEPFTSASVKHTLDRIIDPASKARITGYWQSYDHTETPDEYTAVIKTKTPVGTMLSNLAITMMLPPKAAKPMAEFPVGTGPFKFVEWVVDDHLTMVANADSWQGAPKLDKIIFRSIKEQTTRFSALLSGQVDIVDQVLPEQIGAAQSSAGVKIVKQPTTQLRSLWLQGGVKPFDDNRVRQAVKYAIDTKTIIDSVMQGAANPVDGVLAPNVTGYVKQAPYSYDPDKAKQLLADAGYKDGFSIELKFGAELYPKQKELAETVAAQLAQVGIKVKVSPQDQALWVQELLALKWDMEIVGANSPANDGDDPLRRLYHSSNKRISWSDPTLDKLLLAQQAEVDPAKRMEEFAQIGKILWDQGPVVFLFSEVETYGVRDRVQGFVPAADQIFRLYDVSVKQ